MAAIIIYNITTQVSWGVHDRWKEWLLNQQLPAFLTTGIFSHHQLVRLLDVDDTDGPTYALQLYVKTDQSIDNYKRRYLSGFKSDEQAMWGNNIFSFSSMMEVIN